MVCENLPLKALHPAARRGRQGQKMLLEGYNILGPDKSGDIPHSQGRVTARRANNNYWGDVSVCKTEAQRTAWRARSLVFCERVLTLDCVLVHPTGQLATHSWARLVKVYQHLCSHAHWHQPARTKGIYCCARSALSYHCNRQAESKFSPGIYGQQRI